MWLLLPDSVTVCAHADSLKALQAKVWLSLLECETVCAHADSPKALQAKSVAFAARLCDCLCTCRRSQSAAGSASTPLESLPLLQQQPTTQQHTDHQKLQEQAQQAKAQTHSRQHNKGKKDGAGDGASPAENLLAHADEAAAMSTSAGTVAASVSSQQCLCPCHNASGAFAIYTVHNAVLTLLVQTCHGDCRVQKLHDVCA